MDGILCIDKPPEYTSFDVIARLRGMSKTKKLGHSGTLDPMATGVLPVFFGAATKAIGLLPNDDKRYEAQFQLGVTTDTQDLFGRELTRAESRVAGGELRAALADFVGEIEQVPPMFSAVRVKGRRLYDIARAGGVVEREPRRIRVYSLELLAFDEQAQRGTLAVFCGKGTYVRTLIHDLGERLGPGGAMGNLRRTEACGFALADCVTLEQAQALAEQGELAAALLPPDRLFLGSPAISLNAVQAEKFCNGVRLDLNRLHWSGEPGLRRVYGAAGEFLGLARPDPGDLSLRVEKLFAVR